MTIKSILSGFSSHIPEKVVTNKDLEALVDTTSDWISSRTGILQRNILPDDKNNSDLAVAAAIKAVAKSKIDPQKITHILVATCTPDTLCPSVSTRVAEALQVTQALALDINAACSGFLYGLELANAFILSNPKAHVLLIASEALSRRINWQDRSTCVLFGDGAGAVMISRESNQSLSAELEDIICKVDGAYRDHIVIGGGTTRVYNLNDPICEDYFVSMKGREVFKYAVRSMTAICKEILDKNKLSLEDIDLYIPHQANTRIIEAVGERLQIESDKVFINVQSFGNTSAASIIVALNDAIEQGKIRQGMRVLMSTFGGGYTWAGAIIKF